MSTYYAVTDSFANSLWYSKPFPIWSCEPGQNKKVKLIFKYLTRAWYKNKPSGRSRLRADSLNRPDDSEPYLAHQRSARGLILKSCDRPFVAALNRLSTCQRRCPAAALHTLAIIKLLTSALSVTPWQNKAIWLGQDYCRCSGQLCHAEFTCLVLIVLVVIITLAATHLMI